MCPIKRGKRRKISPIAATHLLKQNILYYGRGYLIDQQPTSSTKFVRNRWYVIFSLFDVGYHFKFFIFNTSYTGVF